MISLSWIKIDFIMSTYIKFNKSDTTYTLPLLKELGFTDAQLQDGLITFTESDAAGVDHNVLREIARAKPDGLERHPENRRIYNVYHESCNDPTAESYECVYDLSPEESKLISQHSKKSILFKLLKKSQCDEPSDQLLRGSSVLVQNILDIDIYDSQIRMRSSCDAKGHEKAGFGIRDVFGIHYHKDQVPEEIAKAGESVIRVSISKSGRSKTYASIVMVESSEEKDPDDNPFRMRAYHLVGADHVLRQNAIFKLPNGAYLDETGVPSHPYDKASLESDMVVLRNANKRGFPGYRPLPFSKSPPKAGEKVWMIGYPTKPSLAYFGLEDDAPQIHFTRGIVERFDPQTQKVIIAGQVTPGYSGGAIVRLNDEGKAELVAIIQQSGKSRYKVERYPLSFGEKGPKQSEEWKKTPKALIGHSVHSLGL